MPVIPKRVISLDYFAEVSETVDTQGADASSATTTTFMRVFRAYVASVGVYGNTNVANIEIETTGAQTVALIKAGKGQTQMALYTIPAGKTGHLTNVQIQADAARTVGFRMFRREGADDTTAPMPGLRMVLEFTAISLSLMRDYPETPSFPAKTDIITQANADAGGTSAVSAEFDVLLVDD
jgi:hypothetical protein